MFAALTIAVAVVLCAHCGLSDSDLLCLAPALLLGATLLLRRYPGERLLTTLAARRQSGRARPQTGAPFSPSRTRARVPRGGLLIAFALAVRPPPAALSAS